MPALETVGQYVEECRRLLQDEIPPFRYPDDDIVDALNVGLQEARRLRADLFLPLFEVPWIDPDGAIQASTVITLDQQYRPSLVYDVIGRVQLRDDEATTDQRAAMMLQKFVAQMLTIAS
jgi:hypothetical protein